MRIYRKRDDLPWEDVSPEQVPTAATFLRDLNTEEVVLHTYGTIVRFRRDNPDIDQKLFDALVDIEHMALRLKAYLTPAADDAVAGTLSDDEVSDILGAAKLLSDICDEAGI